MLFNALNAFSELPTQMVRPFRSRSTYGGLTATYFCYWQMGRPILFKQVNFVMYRPGDRSIASNFAEMPFNMPQIFLFWWVVPLTKECAR